MLPPSATTSARLAGTFGPYADALLGGFLRAKDRAALAAGWAWLLAAFPPFLMRSRHPGPRSPAPAAARPAGRPGPPDGRRGPRRPRAGGAARRGLRPGPAGPLPRRRRV